MVAPAASDTPVVVVVVVVVLIGTGIITMLYHQSYLPSQRCYIDKFLMLSHTNTPTQACMNVYMYVYMYVCMYVCMYKCVYACIFVCGYVYMYERIKVGRIIHGTS